MLVSHRYKFIYTKTVKTAGTSVESFFEPYCMKEGEWSFSHARNEYISEAGIIGYRGNNIPDNCVWYNHMPAVKIKTLLGDDIWNSYFKFCVIRNPFSKAVSHYYFRGKKDLFTGKKVFLKKFLLLREKDKFQEYLKKIKPPLDRNKYMINGKFCMDDVIRQESLNQDIERICNKLSIPYEPEKIPFLKKKVHQKKMALQKIYSDEAKAILEQIYAFELEYFNYSFPNDK